MPKLWNHSIETHRLVVRDAIIDAAAALVAGHGLLSVTMSQIAESTGIGRATLYKYFPDIQSILLAWHERQLSRHLDYLAQVQDQPGGAGDRLHAVLEAYALISQQSRGHHDTEVAAFLHADARVGRAQQRVRGIIREVLIEGAESGYVRDDVEADELVSFVLHALAAARSLPSKAAVRRLVMVTVAGLRPHG